MQSWELVITAIALSMDAFAVAICKGLATERVRLKHMLVVGLWFGGFQALMPLIGYLVGTTFEEYITSIDHWVAFVLLGFIGGKMIKEALESRGRCDCENTEDSSLGFGIMLAMAVATSIDALAVGVSFALLPDVNIAFAISSIGVITFILSAAGVKIGQLFGSKYKFLAELIGGIVLVLIGVKILLEHLGVLVL